MKKETNAGVITLEACISVLSFLILMLLLSGLFVMFMAQNITSHVILQTSESLSLDVFSTEKLTSEGSSAPQVNGYVRTFVVGLFGNADDNPNFVTNDRWYEGNSVKVANTVKNRFVGYLSGGDESKADELLEQMNVVDGLDGLDFSESYVANDTLYIILKYELEYDFNIWDIGTVNVEQKTCSKLWK